jgi:hypothetical protein
MPVDPSVTRLIVAVELRLAEAMARQHGWEINPREDGLSLVACLTSQVDKEEYSLEISCDNYKELPPLFEFITAKGEQRVVTAQPSSSDSFFHPKLLICYPFNRGAFQIYQGPHGDWPLANWQALSPGANRLGDMLAFIQYRLNCSTYTGRRKQ